MSSTTTTTSATPPKSRRKITRSPRDVLNNDVFIYTCHFTSSILDLLNFREAMGERDLVIPVASGVSGQNNSTGAVANTPDTAIHSGETGTSSQPSSDYVRKLSQFQQVSEEIVLAQWPSLKPLKKTMHNKARWLNIGRVLELRNDEEENDTVKANISKIVRDEELQAARALKTEYCREVCAMICDTVTCFHEEGDIYTALLCMARFVHPVHGNWVHYEGVQDDESGQEYTFKFPTSPDGKQTEEVNFYRSPGSNLEEKDATVLWKYLTSPLCEDVAKTKKMSGVNISPQQEREMLNDLLYFWRPFACPITCFVRTFEYYESDYYDQNYDLYDDDRFLVPEDDSDIDVDAEIEIEMLMREEEENLKDQRENQEIEKLYADEEEYYNCLIEQHLGEEQD